MRFLFLTLSLFIFNSFGQELNFPALTSPVVDEAQYLSTTEKEALDQKIRNFYKQGGYQIQILTIKNLQGYAIEEYSIRLAEKWKIGRKDQGDGVIILISKDDRKLRIEIGQGIEDKITDYQSSIILQNILIPAFKSGAYYGGLDRTLNALMGKAGEDFQAVASNKIIRPKQVKLGVPANFVAPIFLGSFFIYLILYHFFRKNKLLRALSSAIFFGLIAYIIFKALAFIVFALFFGLFIGLIGPLNFLILMMHGSGRGGGLGGGGGSFGGGGGWSGGGGGFSGGGASGDF